jgi:hypothetical protein
MKKFILLVLFFFVVALTANADSGPDLAIYQPGNWTSPLICSLTRDATMPDYTLKKGVTVYARFAIKNEGDEAAGVGHYVIKVDVELIDIVGRVVEKKKLDLKRGREDLNLGKFRSGIYFLRVFSGENNQPDVHKITVLR